MGRTHHSPFRNDRGDQVDPVPWIVVCGVAFLLCYAYLPQVLLTFGLDLRTSLAVVTVLFAAAVVISFHQQIRTARPDLIGEVPAVVRMRRLFLAMVIGAVVLLSIQIALVLFGPLPS